jgi:transcriptional regulator with XRE-family HTH domain
MTQPEKSQFCHFSSRLHDSMQARGWKGVDLAAAAEVTPTSVSRYLSGKAEPRSAELLRLARALGTSMEWLLEGTAPLQTPKVAEDPAAYTATARRVSQAAATAASLAETLRSAEDQLERLRSLLT